MPRWALLPREERAITQVIAERTTASAFGLVLLEDVIDAVVEDGMDRSAAMHWMAELAQRGWLDQAGAECEAGERLEGKPQIPRSATARPDESVDPRGKPIRFATGSSYQQGPQPRSAFVVVGIAEGRTMVQAGGGSLAVTVLPADK